VKRLAVLLLVGIAALLLRRREPTATAYLGDVQRDDYLWSVLSGGEER
jgi:hypothetical protein